MSRRAALAACGALAGCVSIGVGGEQPAQVQLMLVDPGLASTQRRAEPVVDALIVQPLPAGAMADTLSIAFSRQANTFAFYQFATWTERPVRRLPRLLQERLEARGLASAVGMLGDPLQADWLLGLGIEALYHDVSVQPGRARLALLAELFDRRRRQRVARRAFTADVPTAQDDSAALATALSTALAQAYDDLLPWLEDALQRAAASGVALQYPRDARRSPAT